MIHSETLAELLGKYEADTAAAFAASEPGPFLLVKDIGDAPQKAIWNQATELQDATLAQYFPPEDVRVVSLAALAPESSPFLVGRSDACHLHLPHATISKTHLQIQRVSEQPGYLIHNPGTSNETTLNGSRLNAAEPTALREGDVLELAHRYRITLVSAKTLHSVLRAARMEMQGLAQASIAHTAAVPRAASKPRHEGLLAGKVAVVTGAGRGLGRAYAHRFAQEGCRVVVNDVGAEPDGTGRDEDIANSVVREIEEAGGVATASFHDISKAEQVDAMFALATEKFSAVDILVCSAGALHVGTSLLETDESVFDHLLEVNARGTFLCVRAAARHMVQAQKRGRIITTSSLAAMTGNAGLFAYSASKAAVYGLSQTAAQELAPHGIMVNVLTPMAYTRLTQNIPAIAAMPNSEELLSPRFVADVALFLASDLSQGITGQVVDVGGQRLCLFAMQQRNPVLPEQDHWTPQELQRRWAELNRHPEG